MDLNSLTNILAASPRLTAATCTLDVRYPMINVLLRPVYLVALTNLVRA